jgi:hypothetical protein
MLEVARVLLLPEEDEPALGRRALKARKHRPAAHRVRNPREVVRNLVRQPPVRVVPVLALGALRPMRPSNYEVHSQSEGKLPKGKLLSLNWKETVWGLPTGKVGETRVTKTLSFETVFVTPPIRVPRVPSSCSSQTRCRSAPSRAHSC